MITNFLLDTGPLVAYLSRRDRYHQWAVEQFRNISSPLLTCEPVITEACFLVRNIIGGSDAVFGLIESDWVRIGMSLTDEITHAKKLMSRYSNVPMSLADACMVRMSEKYGNATIITLDSDFKIYRRHGRRTIPLLIPN